MATPERVAFVETLAAHLSVAVAACERYRAEQETRVAAQFSQRAAEHALARAESAIKVRDEFLSVAAHELKTPVTSLLGTAQLVARRLDTEGTLDPARARWALQVIDRQAKRVTYLTECLLDVSRIQGGQLSLDRQRTDLAALAQGVVAQAEAQIEGQARDSRVASDRAPCRLHLALPPHPVSADVDRVRLEQVLTNLVDNALRYSPGGGDVTVAVVPQGEVVHLVVRDHGLGIPAEKRAGLFQRYHQAHTEHHQSGLGLGLFISRQIVELHGGRIEAEFPTDGGTRMVVTLPRRAGVDDAAA
jgi:signal transduction histidine kinase